ncbi:MAG: hypothetical protein CMH52_01865 [Myxococcales bacterium]|nr:hypothetical protein [Myxococcales bacterium]|tara:strand:+ start:133 stop:990 length:858 start_codon:yes stop_codon:yes gene_type:complete
MLLEQIHALRSRRQLIEEKQHLPLPRQAFELYLLVRDTQRYIAVLDDRLVRAARERNDALVVLGQTVLNDDYPTTVTGAFHFESTMKQIKEHRNSLTSTIQGLEEQIGNLRGRLVEILSEKDVQLSELKTDERLLSHEIKRVRKNAQNEDEIEDLDVRLAENRQQQKSLADERTRLEKDGLVEFDQLSEHLAGYVRQIKDTSVRAEKVQRDLGRAVLQSDPNRPEPSVNALAREKLGYFEKLREQRIDAVDFLAGIDTRPLSKFIGFLGASFLIAIALVWLITLF